MSRFAPSALLAMCPTASAGLQVPRFPTPGHAGNTHSDTHDGSVHASSFTVPVRGDIAGSEPHYTWFYRASDQVDRGVNANKVAKANKAGRQVPRQTGFRYA